MQLHGEWHKPSEMFPDHEEYMVVDSNHGRIVTFFPFKLDPVIWTPMPAWYKDESGSSVCTTLLPNKPMNSSYPYRFDNNEVYWTYGGREHRWLPLPPEERPVWLDTRLAKVYSDMDRREGVNPL